MADPYAEIKHAIKGSESSGRFFRNGKIIKNTKSSAKGPYQFVDDTWNSMNKISQSKYGKSLDINNPQDHELAMNILISQNVSALKNKSLPITPSTLYMMHFKGDTNFVRTAIENPNLPASSVFSKKEIAANRSILSGTIGNAANILQKKVIQNSPRGSNFNQQNFNRMPNIQDQPPKNTNFQAGQSMNKAGKDFLIKKYKEDIRALKKRGEDASEYNRIMYEKGYIGYNSDGEAIGFLADAVRGQMSRNKGRDTNDTQIKKTALNLFGKVFQDNTEIFQIPQGIRTGDKRFEKKANSVQLKDLSNLDEKFTAAINQIAKLDPGNNSVRKILSDVQKKLKSNDPKQQFEALDTMQRTWQNYSGQKADFFKKDANGKIVAGSDIMYDKNKNYFTFVGKKGFNAQDPKVIGTNTQDIGLPNYTPVLDGYSTEEPDLGTESYSATGGADYDFGQSNIDYRGYQDYGKYDNGVEETKRLKMSIAEREKAAKALAETNAKLKEENQKADEDERLSTLTSALETGADLKNPDLIDPGTFKKGPLPIDKIAQGLIGVVLGKNMVDEELPLRDEKINNGLLSFLHEQRRISDLGMNPADEAAAKQGMAEAYQMGIDNLANNSGGNRNLILGNAGNLDNINADQMMKLSMVDAKMKESARESYGKAMEYVNNFENTKQIANNERKYQDAVQKRAAGGSLMAGAFKSMSDALGDYNKSDAQRMYEVKADVDLFGWSPKVPEDGKGTTFGTKSKYDAESKKLKNLQDQNKFLLEKFSKESDEVRRDFIKNNKNATFNQQLMKLEGMYGKHDYDPSILEGQINAASGTINTGDDAKVTTTVMDPATGQPVSQESKPSEATVPMGNSAIINSQGGVTPLPLGEQKKVTEALDPNVLTPTSPLGTKPIIPVIPPKKEGIQLATDANQFDINMPIISQLGLEKDYNKKVEENDKLKLIGETEDERYNTVKNIISKYQA